MSLTSYRAAPPRDKVVGSLRWFMVRIRRPGSDRLSRALRRSTIGAEGFHGRVRDGIGCLPLAIATRSSDPDMPHDISEETSEAFVASRDGFCRP